MIRPLRRFARGHLGQRGQAIVEFAIVLPMLLILVFGILEFAFILTNQIELYNAARDGARAGAIPTGQTRGQMTTAANTAATSSSGAVISCTGKTTTVTFDNSSPSVPTEVTVTTNCTYQPITPLGQLVSGLMGPFTQSGQSTKMIEP